MRDGDKGDMVVTCLYKDDIAPCIRFNTHDVSAYRTDQNQTGMAFRRIAGFLGRSDNMVKLRGINVFPHAIGALLDGRSDVTGEYVCRVRREGGRDAMHVAIEHRGRGDPAEFAALLRAGLSVEVEVELVAPGATAAATQIDVRQKPLRLVDERGL